MKGCPLFCQWCHNPEGIDPAPFWTYKPERCIRCGACVENCPEQALLLAPEGVVPSGSQCSKCFTCTESCPAEARQQVGRKVAAVELFDELQKDIPFYDTSGGGVTFSGGEPLMQAEFLIELLKLCGSGHIHRAVDTTGYASPETLMAVAVHTDLFLYDLKMMDSAKHERYTGVPNRLILDNLKQLAHQGAGLIIRIPLVPGINDDTDNLDRTGAFLNLLPGIKKVDVLPYHAFQKSKYIRFGMNNRDHNTTPPSSGLLSRVKEHLESFGLEVRIGG